MLEFKNVSKAFGDHVVLNDISLDIKKGEIISLLGEHYRLNKLHKIIFDEYFIINKHLVK